MIKTSMENCTICRSEKLAVLNEDPNIFVCSNCDHTFTVLPIEQEEKYGDDYYIQVHKNWFENPDLKIFGIVEKRIAELKKADSSVLDVGCGKGDFLRYLESRGLSLKLSGIDLTDNKNGAITYIKGDFLRHDLSEKYDFITNFAVIEHINDLDLFIKKIDSCIKPGGYVFTVTVNNDSLVYKVARVLKKIGVNGPFDRLYSKHHLQHFTNLSLRSLFEKNNYKTIEQFNYNYTTKAVDMPVGSPVSNLLNKIAISILFFISNHTNQGILQLLICKKTEYERTA